MKRRDLLSILVLSGSFLLGAVIGNLCVVYADTEVLRGYICADGGQISFGGNLFAYFLWPALMLLSGFSLIGVFVVPLLTAAKAFTLSYAVSSSLEVFGVYGLLPSIFSLGLPNFIYIPCVLLVANSAFRSSKSLLAGQVKPATLIRQPGQYVEAGIYILLIFGLASFQQWVQPLIQNRF